MSARSHDRGLHAAARVRGVRENDSRIGLQLALAERRTREARVVELSDRLAAAPAELDGSPAAMVALRLGMQHLGDTIRTARDDATAQALVTDDALARWQADKARLSAVEQLLERRAARRRTAVAKAEAKELDDIASARWVRGVGQA
jgi:flagellar FliJ protein